jgi:glycine/serine hydroxymethyltransferase
MKETEMKIIARIFSDAVKNKDYEVKLANLKQEVLEMCGKFPIYK